MKRNLLLSVCLLIAHFLFAVTEEEARVYFRDCIGNLDPIEGCYSIEVIGDYANFGSAGTYHTSKRKVENFLTNECYIVKKNAERDGKYLICWGDTKQSDWESYVTIETIGETGAYKFILRDADGMVIASCHAILNNHFQFSATFINSSSATVSSSSGTIAEGHDRTLIMNFIKSYPTASMYREGSHMSAKGKWSGSGFALKDGYVVTNYHVYNNAEKIKIYGVNGYDNVGLSAEYVSGDKANDIALLRINDKNFIGFDAIPYNIRKSILDVGEYVFALGYPSPDIMGSEIKFTDGTVSSRTGLQNDMRVYQISVPIQPGNSGGPMFDKTGSIAGITSSGINRDAYNYENVNYAIKNNYLVNLVQSSVGMQILPTGNALYGKTKEEQIRLAKNFVFRIECSSGKDVQDQPMSKQLSNDEVQEEQEPTVEHIKMLSYKNHNYYLDGTLLTKEEYASFLKLNSPKAYKRYTNKKTIIGPTLLGIGGVSAITGIGIWLGAVASNYNASVTGSTTFTLIGMGFIGAGMPLTIVGFVQKKNSYEIYNEEREKDAEQIKKVNKRPDKYINLGICQNGIGLQLTF